MLYYRDIEDRNHIRRTPAKPVGVRRDGPLNVWGLVLKNRSSEVWIPRIPLVRRKPRLLQCLQKTRSLRLTPMSAAPFPESRQPPGLPSPHIKQSYRLLVTGLRPHGHANTGIPPISEKIQLK